MAADKRGWRMPDRLHLLLNQKWNYFAESSLQDGSASWLPQQDTLSARSLSLLYISSLERERRWLPGTSFPNLPLHLQPLEQALLEQQRSSSWERQKRCVVRLAYRSKGYKGMKWLLFSPFPDPGDVAVKIRYMWFFYYYFFLLDLSLATESSLEAFSLSELKYKLSPSAVEGPPVKSSDVPVLTASLCVPQL